MKKIFLSTTFILLTILILKAADHYKNFKVAVYSRAYETAKMGDEKVLEPIWDEISQLKQLC